MNFNSIVLVPLRVINQERNLQVHSLEMTLFKHIFIYRTMNKYTQKHTVLYKWEHTNAVLKFAFQSLCHKHYSIPRITFTIKKLYKTISLFLMAT